MHSLQLLAASTPRSQRSSSPCLLDLPRDWKGHRTGRAANRCLFIWGGSPLSICAKVLTLAIPQQVQQHTLRLRPVVAKSLRTPTNVYLPAPFRAIHRLLKAQKVEPRPSCIGIGVLWVHSPLMTFVRTTSSRGWRNVDFWRQQPQGLFKGFMVHINIRVWGSAATHLVFGRIYELMFYFTFLLLSFHL